MGKHGDEREVSSLIFLQMFRKRPVCLWFSDV